MSTTGARTGPGEPTGAADGDADSAFADFAQAYVGRLPDDYVDSISDQELMGQVANLFDFVQARGTAAEAVRVFNPDAERHGYETAGTVVEIVVDDSPFLVDSVTAELVERQLSLVLSVHPVLGVERDERGRVTDVRPARHSRHRESVQHHELDRRLEIAQATELERALRQVLGDVRLAVRDFEAMQGAVERMVEVAEVAGARYDRAEINEAVGFLRWLLDDNFVFLGYREYRIVPTAKGPGLEVVPGTGLGLLSRSERSAYAQAVPLADLPPDLRRRYEEGFLLVVSKTNRTSTVHRRARMDYVGVRRIGPDGEVAGEARLVGLFTSRAYMSEAATIPLLRRKLARILEEQDLIEGSHDFKAVTQYFNSFPKDELFATPIEDIHRSIRGLLSVEEKENVRLFVRPDLLHRSVSLMVVLPRDRFNAELRRRLQELFRRAYGGTSVDYRLSLDEADAARIHFTVWVEGGQVPDVAFDQLEREVVELARTWEDRLHERLARSVGDDRATELVQRWSRRLPEYYTSATALDVAAGDVQRLDELVDSEDDLVVGLQRETAGTEQLTRLTVYRRGAKLDLSEILPALEALGLRVVEEIPTRLLEGTPEAFIHDFGVRGPSGEPLDLDHCGDRVAAAVAAVLTGRAESDSLDRLLLWSLLDHADVAILRAYRTYWRRVSPAFTVGYVNDTLVAHPAIAAGLVRLFRLKFDPAAAASSNDYGAARTDLLRALDAVATLDEDRILRGFLGLVDATVRTNAFKPDRSSLSFKFHSAEVPGMPRPVPLFEIFVYAPEVEGVHLRGGAIARGGLRWSDRREDYRAEVLGLMKAQMTKNAVIVPTGAKGGFVLRRPPGRGERPADVVRRAYEVFIRGMLDLTDNLVGGEVVAPAGVRVHDGGDPYLVVAADRGTAALSDTANAIAAEYGFWLGDAFASGGSSGYDHKALGITARGAWESVKRHLHDIGLDLSAQTITAVGIGDMSGDVFGNGMLQTERMQLVAAFDHRHVFLDPDPDPERSYKERRRLFEMAGSTWADYDATLLSAGGGVYPRSAKSIDLPEPVRRRLSIDAAALTPAELIQAILRAPVDLLWVGGIGTYVKASSETNAQSEDRTNDAVRVDASELRCRMVAEGANLGFTQRGRIEYAERGGHINTDFIDNSGGVDCSDREVNLKILLRVAEERGGLDRAERDALVAAVAGHVVDRVVYDNFLQAQILSQEVRASSTRLEAYDDLMTGLEHRGRLNRRLEHLPSSEEMTARGREGRGMARPELAVLLAYAKRDLRQSLLGSDLPDDPHFVFDLLEYFPQPVTKRFRHLVADHPLRRDIVATTVANQVIDSQGITFVGRLEAETGARPDEVVRSYRLARECMQAGDRWRAVESLSDRVPAEVTNELMDGIDWLVEAVTRWFLRRGMQRPMGEEIAARQGKFAELADMISEAGPPEWRQAREEQVTSLVVQGIPTPVARRHVYQAELVHAPDIVELAQQCGRTVTDVARLFFSIGHRYRIDWLENLTEDLAAGTRWQRWAIQTLEDDLMQLRRQLAERVLAAAGPGDDPLAALDAYVTSRSEGHQRLEEFFRTLDRHGGDDLASLLVAARQVGSLTA